MEKEKRTPLSELSNTVIVCSFYVAFLNIRDIYISVLVPVINWVSETEAGEELCSLTQY